MLADRENYLHKCLRLHGQVTVSRYDKRQDLGKVERRVARMLKGPVPMWEIVEAIHDTDAFDASMFGSFDRANLKGTIDAIDQIQWRDLAKHELVARLFEAYRQIEPVSVVLRFIDPQRFGIMSSPVQTVLGIRPRRKPAVTYEAYLKSLKCIRKKRDFDRVADVEMALWVLQVGVLDGVRSQTSGKDLPQQLREKLANAYKEDAELRRIQAKNLTKQLLSELTKLDVADALLSTDAALAGQIAGIEFELRIVKASPRSGGKQGPNLSQHIESLRPPYRQLLEELRCARDIRNRAIHEPDNVSRADVEYLIAVARKLPPLG